VRPLGSHAELLAASGNDAFVRWQVRADVPLQAWDVGGAVARLREGSFRGSAVLVP
jgi:hypothetical protein